MTPRRPAASRGAAHSLSRVNGGCTATTPSADRVAVGEDVCSLVDLVNEDIEETIRLKAQRSATTELLEGAILSERNQWLADGGDAEGAPPLRGVQHTASKAKKERKQFKKELKQWQEAVDSWYRSGRPNMPNWWWKQWEQQVNEPYDRVIKVSRGEAQKNFKDPWTGEMIYLERPPMVERWSRAKAVRERVDQAL